MSESMETIIMNLVVNGGNARSLAMQAIRAAREEDFKLADELMEASANALEAAHQVQTDIIRQEVRGDHIEVQLLMVHAQDHVMNAMTVRDLAAEIIELCKKNQKGD